MTPKRIEPRPGQESVWDYPRPPRAERTPKDVVIEFGGRPIVRTNRAVRVLETSHPPVYYVPIEDVADGALRPSERRSTVCEWKGQAIYFDVVAIPDDGLDKTSTNGSPQPPEESSTRIARAAAWSYPTPVTRFEILRGYVAFYPSRMDACYVAGERVRAQDGDFYGGWITSDIVGPFKGGPGTWGW